MATVVCCINIFRLTGPTVPPYLAKRRCRWNVLFATKYLTTELANSKLNMVYLAELLVVMTDGLKIVRIHARNVPRVHGQAPRRRRVSRISLSLSLQESDGIACWCAGVRSCWNIKNRLRTTCACRAVASEQESCRDSMPSSFWHQIWEMC